MGRPLKKKLFGTPSASTNTIKVQFHNGTASVKGYIVEQLGSKRFTCKDASGNTATCRLVAKASADLAAGEMTITVKYDNGTASQITKIADRVVTVDGVKMPWTFDTSTSDGKVQMEEAGDDTSLTNATDLEGDDVPPINGDYPVPGSGGIAIYRTGAAALTGISYSNIGTPYVPAGSVSTVSNSASGLYRKKYDGNFSSAYNSAASTWDYGFFGSATFIKGIADPYVSWGKQLDGAGSGEHNFSIEWKGYIQVPTSQNYNIYCEADDQIAVWIGTAATSAPSNASKAVGGPGHALPSGVVSGESVNTNSATLDSTKWYPVRVWFGEWNGACMAQVYLQGADGNKYNFHEISTAYNTSTNGF